MARFTGKKAKETPALNMGSMSDIIFMLLFFFMVITTMRESSLYVKILPPQASEVSKLEKKSLISYINVGKPLAEYEKTFGTDSRIQLNDQIAEISDIKMFVEIEKTALGEEGSLLTMAIKADKDTKMGLIGDIKHELRVSNALKIIYNARKGSLQ